MHAPCCDADGTVLPIMREKSRAPNDMEDEAGDEDDPSRAERRPKRRKTSDMVTMMEIRIRTMMIHVWSVHMRTHFSQSRIGNGVTRKAWK